MAGSDVRPRVRPGVVRVRAGETAIRTVLSVAAPEPLSNHMPATRIRWTFNMAGGRFPLHPLIYASISPPLISFTSPK
jgi:hypothetical protein